MVVVKEFKCKSCGKPFRIEMTEGEHAAYIISERSIQDIFPHKDAFYREALISGLCYDCQSKLFNAPKPGEDWGESVGECDRCGAPMYLKDAGVCPCCGEHKEFSK